MGKKKKLRRRISELEQNNYEYQGVNQALSERVKYLNKKARKGDLALVAMKTIADFVINEHASRKQIYKDIMGGEENDG